MYELVKVVAKTFNGHYSLFIGCCSRTTCCIGYSARFLFFGCDGEPFKQYSPSSSFFYLLLNFPDNGFGYLNAIDFAKKKKKKKTPKLDIYEIFSSV